MLTEEEEVVVTASDEKAGAVAQIAQVARAAGARDCEVVVIGAGPYGLSSASHLKAAGYDVRVFGKAMQFWAEDMPAGMLLRSPRVASNISSPKSAYSLEAYERQANLRPLAPLPLATFADYGRWFGGVAKLDLDSREIAAISKNAGGFRVVLRDGSVFNCSRVVVAAGVKSFQRVPVVFRSLDPSHVSHCYQGCDVRGFVGKHVVVIGAGQSALETGALLHEGGAIVEIVARTSMLRWIGAHPWLHNLGPVSAMLYSSHDVGPAGISRLVAAPNVVKYVPLKVRDKIRKRAVRSAGSKWLPARLKDVKVSLGRSVRSSRSIGRDVELTLDDGTIRIADHVVLGTGYEVDVRRYSFLSPDLLNELDVFEGYPRLRSGFRTSIDGLLFVGATAARTFGPLLYFVAGTEFASREIVSKFNRGR
jgi:Pyridine nucleotide-disulphide oxidoreductase